MVGITRDLTGFRLTDCRLERRSYKTEAGAWTALEGMARQEMDEEFTERAWAAWRLETIKKWRASGVRPSDEDLLGLAPMQFVGNGSLQRVFHPDLTMDESIVVRDRLDELKQADAERQDAEEEAEYAELLKRKKPFGEARWDVLIVYRGDMAVDHDSCASFEDEDDAHAYAQGWNADSTCCAYARIFDREEDETEEEKENENE